MKTLLQNGSHLFIDSASLAEIEDIQFRIHPPREEAQEQTEGLSSA